MVFWNWLLSNDGNYRCQALENLLHFQVGTVSMYKIQKHFQNVMLVGMASEISKKHTYKCVDRSRHN